MKDFFKKLLATVLTICVLFALAACKKENVKPEDNSKTEPTETANVTETNKEATIEITFMSTFNNGEGWYKGGAKEDIVADALEAKTGVRVKQMITVTSSMKAIEKFNLLYATNDLPEVWGGWYGSGDRNLYDVAQKMMKDDMLWLWDYEELKELAPDAVGLVSPIAYEFAKGVMGTGSKVGILLNRAHGWAPELANKYPEIEKANNFPFFASSMLRFRDDILKSIIPSAKTAAELEEIYKKNGKLTWDDVYLPELDSFEKFKDFLYNVKKKYGSKGIIPFGPEQSIMNFASRVFLGGWHFAEFDPIKIDIKMTTIDNKQGWINIAKEFNKMFNDGILDMNYSLLTGQQYDEKLAQGKYAVAKDGGVNSVNQVLTGANQPFRYVRVPVSYDTATLNVRGYQQQEPARCGYGYIFNKKKLNEEQIKKVLNYFNYHATKEGSELISWGPKEAGLWEEVNGKRVWKDQAFIDVILGKKPVGEMKDFVYYGLQPGGAGHDNKYIHDYYFMPHLSGVSITGPTVDVVSDFNLDYELIKAFASYNKGYYDDMLSSWNGTQPLNKVMWDNYGTSNAELNKIISGKTSDFDKKMEEYFKFYKETMKAEEYYQQMRGYIEVVKKFKNNMRFHPEADMSKLK